MSKAEKKSADTIKLLRKRKNLFLPKWSQVIS